MIHALESGEEAPPPLPYDTPVEAALPADFTQMRDGLAAIQKPRIRQLRLKAAKTPNPNALVKSKVNGAAEK